VQLWERTTGRLTTAVILAVDTAQKGSSISKGQW
jgi:hypothetical protein